MVREAPDPASARRRWAGRVPRPPPPHRVPWLCLPSPRVPAARGKRSPSPLQACPTPLAQGRDWALSSQGVYLRLASELRGPEGLPAPGSAASTVPSPPSFPAAAKQEPGRPLPPLLP